MSGHIASAGREDWCTPKHIVEAVHATFGHPPNLDPCSNSESIVGAAHTYQRPEHDGLTAAWPVGSVYVNPPFGKGIKRWVGRCIGHYTGDGSGTNGPVIMLLPAAVGTSHWHEYIFPTAARICFLKGRLTFIGAKTGAPFDTAIVLWGDLDDWIIPFEKAFMPLGRLVD